MSFSPGTTPERSDSEWLLLAKILESTNAGGGGGGGGAGVNSFNGRSGNVTLSNGDVTGALTYTPANAASLGTLSTQNANNVAITGGTMTGVTITGAASLNVLKAGDTMTGALTVSARLTADKFSNTQSSVAYAATTDLDFDGNTARSLSLTGDVTFTTSNRAAGRMLKIRIAADGSTRNLTFPAGWKFLGAAAPTSIAANKTAVLSLECWGANDSDIAAAYAVEP